MQASNFMNLSSPIGELTLTLSIEALDPFASMDNMELKIDNKPFGDNTTINVLIRDF